MRAIFISYRREDAEGQAGRLFDDLVMRFGKDAVFMDVAGIEPGRDFRRAIDEQVASCSVLLAVIGKNWLDAKDESGRHRLDDHMDFVRLETASALKRDIPVIPVLVRGASMPRAEQLPSDLTELAYRNAVELTHARWDSDVQVLVEALLPYVELLKKDMGSTKTEPAAKAPGKEWTAGDEQKTLADKWVDKVKNTPLVAGLAFVSIGLLITVVIFIKGPTVHVCKIDSNFIADILYSDSRVKEKRLIASELNSTGYMGKTKNTGFEELDNPGKPGSAWIVYPSCIKPDDTRLLKIISIMKQNGYSEQNSNLELKPHSSQAFSNIQISLF